MYITKFITSDNKYKNLPKYRKEHDTNGKFRDGLITIPKNLFKKTKGHIFQSDMEENHAHEQFFWTPFLQNTN